MRHCIANKPNIKEGILQLATMASQSVDKSTSAAESLVKATVTVLDNVDVRAHFMRASMEAEKRMGAHKMTYMS